MRACVVACVYMCLCTCIEMHMDTTHVPTSTNNTCIRMNVRTHIQIVWEACINDFPVSHTYILTHTHRQTDLYAHNIIYSAQAAMRVRHLHFLGEKTGNKQRFFFSGNTPTTIFFFWKQTAIFFLENKSTAIFFWWNNIRHKCTHVWTYIYTYMYVCMCII